MPKFDIIRSLTCRVTLVLNVTLAFGTCSTAFLELRLICSRIKHFFSKICGAFYIVNIFSPKPCNHIPNKLKRCCLAFSLFSLLPGRCNVALLNPGSLTVEKRRPKLNAGSETHRHASCMHVLRSSRPVPVKTSPISLGRPRAHWHCE